MCVCESASLPDATQGALGRCKSGAVLYSCSYACHEPHRRRFVHSTRTDKGSFVVHRQGLAEGVRAVQCSMQEAGGHL